MSEIEALDKAHVLAALLDRLRADLGSVEASQHAAQSGATHEETRAENPKDTRAIEAQYVARGLAERSEKLRDAIAALASVTLSPLDPDAGVVVTALVTLDDEGTGESGHYFLVPAGGGERLEIDGVGVQTLTPVSPLGRRLMGLELGDDVVLERPRGSLHARVTALR